MIAVTDQILRPPDQLARGDFEMVVRKLADDLAFGMDISRFIGAELEYAKSRPYAPGDTMKMFDWKITARTGKPFVKEYEAARQVPIYLAVDTSASMCVGSVERNKYYWAVRLAAGIGHELENPLAALRGRVELLESMVKSGKAGLPDVLKTTETLKLLADRMASIIRGMKSLSRILPGVTFFCLTASKEK